MAAKKKALAREESRSEVIGRERILLKYWELANLDPEATKGTITGQLKALDSLLAEQGLAPPPAAGQREEAGIYRSAWIRNRNGDE